MHLDVRICQVLSLITTKIRALVQQGHYLEALNLYTNHSPQVAGTPFTFPSLLKACAAISHHSHDSNHNHGKKLHATIITMGLQSDPYISTSLINMYVKCGLLAHAHQVFVKATEREELLQDVTIWNAIIDGYFKFGLLNDGLLLFRRMLSWGVSPDAYTVNMILGICSSLRKGKQVHGYVFRHMFDHRDKFLETALIDMYMRCGRPIDAWGVFDSIKDKSGNIAAWNAMIGGFFENGLGDKSFEFYILSKKEKCEIGSATFSSVLTACEDVESGRMVHCDVVKMGLEWEPYVCTSLLSMYGRLVVVKDAKKVFNGKYDKGVQLWNAMISVCIGNGLVLEGLDNYCMMRLNGMKPDSFTVTNILSACSMIGCYDFGKQVHGEMIKRPIMHGNIAAQSALVTMYAKCGYVKEADSVFSTIQERDEVTWGSMMSGFCQNGKYEECLSLFKAMKAQGLGSDSTIMASLAGASAALECAELGYAIHGFVIKNGTTSDAFVGSALIDMYAKCKLPGMAASVFSVMPHKNLVTWNSLTSCYNRNGLFDLSIDLFSRIASNGLTPDFVSITNALVAISSLATLVKGKILHGYQVRLNVQSDLHVQNALIDMYIKCGCLKYAQRIFDNMSRRNIVTWNSLISGYGSHGDCVKAIELFNQMDDLIPDDITFLALLSACSHSGFVAEGLRLFHLMKVKYNIEPRVEHYVTMTDLWGRAGFLKEAYSFIQSMPCKLDETVLLCLLGACRVHGNIDLGEFVVNQLSKMESSRGSNYVQLLSFYGERDLLDKVVDVRVSMKERGLKKNPGCSWLEMKDNVTVFFSGDTSSPWTLEIHDILSSLRRHMEAKIADVVFAL